MRTRGVPFVRWGTRAFASVKGAATNAGDQRLLPRLALVGAASLASGAIVTLLPLPIFAMVSTACAFALLLLASPAAAILLVLLCRPSIEAFQDVYLPVLGANFLNAAGLLSSLVVAGTGTLALLHRIKIEWSTILRSYGVFLLVCLVSLVLTPDKVRGAADWVRLASYIAVYLLVAATHASEQAIARTTSVIIWSAAVPVAVGMYQFVSGAESITYLGTRQITSVFSHPNGYGIYLALLIPLVMVSLASTESRPEKCFYSLLVAVMLFSLGHTYARVGWLGYLVAVMVIGSTRYRRLIAVAILSIALAFVVPSFKDRLALALTTTPETNSLLARLNIWREALDLFTSSPLLGRGLGSFNTLSDFVARRVAEPRGTHVHSAYLQLLAETGAVGLATYLLVQLRMGQTVTLAVRSVKDRCLQPAVLGALGMLTGTVVMGLTDNILVSPVIQWYLWAVVGLATAALRISQARSERG